MPDPVSQAFHVMAKPTSARCNLRSMRTMADILARGGEAREVMARLADEARTTSRNDPCSCGGGKKFKRCCGA